MKKLGQKGFTLVEGLLVIIVLALVVGVGFYVLNARKDTKDNTPQSTKKSSTSQASQPEPNLKDAVATAQDTYDSLTKYMSADKTANPPTAHKKLDYDFINANKSSFSQIFLDKIAKTPDASTALDMDYFLMCYSGSALLNGVKITGDASDQLNLDSNLAKVKATMSVGPSKNTSASFPVTLVRKDDGWVIISVDLTNCPK